MGEEQDTIKFLKLNIETLEKEKELLKIQIEQFNTKTSQELIQISFGILLANIKIGNGRSKEELVQDSVDIGKLFMNKI